MSEETKKVTEGELAEEKLEEVAGGAAYLKYEGLDGKVEAHPTSTSTRMLNNKNPELTK